MKTKRTPADQGRPISRVNEWLVQALIAELGKIGVVMEKEKGVGYTHWKKLIGTNEHSDLSIEWCVNPSPYTLGRRHDWVISEFTSCSLATACPSEYMPIVAPLFDEWIAKVLALDIDSFLISIKDAKDLLRTMTA